MTSSIAWLHCNNCGALPFERDNDISRFSIANCGHIFCNECVSMSAQSCFVCQHTPFYPRAIDNSLSLQLKSLFTPMHFVYRHVLERVQNVAAFQWAQFELSRTFLQQKEYVTAKSGQDDQSTANINAELSEGIADLKAGISYTQRMLSAMQNDRILNSMTVVESPEVIEEDSRIYGESKKQFTKPSALLNTIEEGECWSSAVQGNSRVARPCILPSSGSTSDGDFPVVTRGCVVKMRSDGLVVVDANGTSNVVVRPSSMKSSAPSRQSDDVIAAETMSANDRDDGVEVGASRIPEMANSRNDNHCGTHRQWRRSRLTKNPYAILCSLTKLNIPISEAQHEALRHMAIRWARKHRIHAFTHHEEPDERCNISVDF